MKEPGLAAVELPSSSSQEALVQPGEIPVSLGETARPVRGIRGSALYQRLIQPIVQSDDSPESIALGAAVGMFVALTPTVGIQMPATLALGSLINRFTRYKMNQLVGVAMCWLSNPVTFIPMYYVHLWVGSWAMGKDTSSLMSFSALQRRVTSYISASAPTTWEYLKGLFLGGLGELVVPMWIGAMIAVAVIAIPTYPITLWAVRRYHFRKKGQA